MMSVGSADNLYRLTAKQTSSGALLLLLSALARAIPAQPSSRMCARADDGGASAIRSKGRLAIDKGGVSRTQEAREKHAWMLGILPLGLGTVIAVNLSKRPSAAQETTTTFAWLCFLVAEVVMVALWCALVRRVKYIHASGQPMSRNRYEHLVSAVLGFCATGTMRIGAARPRRPDTRTAGLSTLVRCLRPTCPHLPRNVH